MRNSIDIIKNSFMIFLKIFTIAVMIFTVFSVFTFDQTERSVLGHKFLIVQSDSMAATDFAAGDVVVIKETDVESVNKGDIISFISQDDENYGQIITHKVREVLRDSEGEVAFITYGTTTGATDPWVVTSKNVVGEYEFSIPKVGHIFKFLKSPLGYVVCILIPFLILILLQAKKCKELYKKYKREIAQEKKAHKDENMALKEEVAALRQQLSEIQKNEKEN